MSGNHTTSFYKNKLNKYVYNIRKKRILNYAFF